MVRNISDPFQTFNNKSGHAVLLWFDGNLKEHSVVFDGKIEDLDPSTFAQCRTGYNYPHRRNYEGWYPFISTGDFLWYESMTELKSLILLEHTEDLAIIGSQPFCFCFADNTRHYPDFFAVSRDGIQTVFDVKVLDRIGDRSREQFVKSTDECRRQGWRHVVLHGAAGWHWKNLQWLAYFRAEDMHPEPDDEQELLDLLQTPRSLAQTVTRLDPDHPASSMPAVYHLMFRQAISYDHGAPLSLDTKLWIGGSHATCHRAQ